MRHFLQSARGVFAVCIHCGTRPVGLVLPELCVLSLAIGLTPRLLARAVATGWASLESALMCDPHKSVGPVRRSPGTAQSATRDAVRGRGYRSASRHALAICSALSML